MKALAAKTLSLAPLTIPESLLFPLVARADAHRRYPQLRFRDICSELLLDALNIDATQFRRDGAIMLGSCLRARWFEQQASQFLRGHPDALGVSLGAGLDTLYMRLCDDIGAINHYWYDVDTPSVIALKRDLLTTTDRYKLLAAESLDSNFIERLRWKVGQPAIFVADGNLMYLPHATVESLIAQLIAAAAWRHSKLVILFDRCSPWMRSLNRRFLATYQSENARASHTSLQWTLHAPRTLERLHPQLRVQKSYDLTRDGGFLPRCLGWLHRSLTGEPLHGCVRLELPAH